MALTEDDLIKIKRMVLTATRKELVRYVDPSRHFTFLRSRLVLDERDCDELRSTTSRVASAEMFVDILIRKGASGYDEFCDALLYEKTQLFLLDRLNRTFEVLKSKVKEHKGKLVENPCEPSLLSTLKPTSRIVCMHPVFCVKVFVFFSISILLAVFVVSVE